jgi:hypothetical protein
MRNRVIGSLALACITACGGDLRNANPAPPASTSAIDSAVPREVALERFRAGLPPVTALRGGEPSREQLVQRFVTAIEQRDTVALSGMTLSKAEFAWLYYPTAREANPPYSLSPDLMWFTHTGRSEKGINAVLATHGGRSLGYLDHHCADEPRVEGENRLWGFCLVRRIEAAKDTVEENLFGLIIERGGAFKFVNYANKLD